MKIFEDESVWGKKVNFVDRNNVVVGYDYEASCCEGFYWVILNYFDPSAHFDFDSEVGWMDLDERKRAMASRGVLDKIPGMRFDTRFLHVDDFGDEGAFDVQAVAVFRLVDGGGGVWYLYLVNAHNGFYGHGWEMKVGQESRFEGRL